MSQATIAAMMQSTAILYARPGERLVIHGDRLGEPERDAEIVGESGGPPFRVRWSGTGREMLIFPGSDASVEHSDSR